MISSQKRIREESGKELKAARARIKLLENELGEMGVKKAELAVGIHE